jgi:hypothetical protein
MGLIYNRDVKDWGKKIRTQVQTKAKSLGVKHRANSPSEDDSIHEIKDRYLTNEKGGNIKRIRFVIRRHLVFVHKGVGKGVPIGLAGSKGTRKAKPFFNEVLDKGMEELADIAASHTGDEIVGRILIK